MIEELGFTPMGFYGIDMPEQKAQDFIRQQLVEIDGRYKDRIMFEGDNRVIQKDIKEKLEKHNVRSVLLGSSWDKELIESHEDGILVRLSIPVTDKVILNKSYVGYNGGFH